MEERAWNRVTLWIDQNLCWNNREGTREKHLCAPVPAEQNRTLQNWRCPTCHHVSAATERRWITLLLWATVIGSTQSPLSCWKRTSDSSMLHHIPKEKQGTKMKNKRFFWLQMLNVILISRMLKSSKWSLVFCLLMLCHTLFFILKAKKKKIFSVPDNLPPLACICLETSLFQAKGKEIVICTTRAEWTHEPLLCETRSPLLHLWDKSPKRASETWNFFQVETASTDVENSLPMEAAMWQSQGCAASVCGNCSTQSPVTQTHQTQEIHR